MTFRDPTYSGPGFRHPRRESQPIQPICERPGCPPELLAEWLRYNLITTHSPEPVLSPRAPKKNDPLVVTIKGKSGPKLRETSNMGMIRATLREQPGINAHQVLARLRQIDPSRFALTKATNICSWLAEARMRLKVRSEKHPGGMIWFLTEEPKENDPAQLTTTKD